jgi:hypothetical protein
MRRGETPHKAHPRHAGIVDEYVKTVSPCLHGLDQVGNTFGRADVSGKSLDRTCRAQRVDLFGHTHAIFPLRDAIIT